MKTFNHALELIAGVAVLMLVIENPQLITKTISLITNTVTNVMSLGNVGKV